MERCSDSECKKLATQLHPIPFCDYHWGRKYSTQYAPHVATELKLDSPQVPFGKFLQWLRNNR